MIQNAVGIRSPQLLHIFVEEKFAPHIRLLPVIHAFCHFVIMPHCSLSAQHQRQQKRCNRHDKQNRIKRRQIGQNRHKRRCQPNRISDISHNFFISRRCMIGKIFQPVQKRRFLIRSIRHCRRTFLNPTHNPPFLQNIRLFAVAFPIPSAHAPKRQIDPTKKQKPCEKAFPVPLLQTGNIKAHCENIDHKFPHTVQHMNQDMQKNPPFPQSDEPEILYVFLNHCLPQLYQTIECTLCEHSIVMNQK